MHACMWTDKHVKLTGLRLFSMTGLRYTGYEITRTSMCSRNQAVTQSGRRTHSIAPLATLTLNNAPPTSRLWFCQMYEDDTLRKMDRSCVWVQKMPINRLGIDTTLEWMALAQTALLCRSAASISNHSTHSLLKSKIMQVIHVPSSNEIVHFVCDMGIVIKFEENKLCSMQSWHACSCAPTTVQV